MRILAIDIGAGTQDILLFDSTKNIENSISLVLPTPSKVLAGKLRTIDRNVFIRGDTIGGGSLTGAILQHLEKGLRVVMEESAAFSIRNDLDEVRSIGIEIGNKPSAGGFVDFKIEEIALPLLKNFLEQFGEALEVDAVAVAVQDHGVAPKDVSDRAFRFEKTEAMLRRDNRAESFHFEEGSIPGYYLRMRSAVGAVRRSSSAPVLVMDTAFSAVLGCLDEVTEPSLVVNVGNGRTIAALVSDRRVEGIYEHHTHELTPKRLESDLRRFARGELSSQEVFAANGHGAVTLRPCKGEPPVVVTGPHREIFRDTSFRFIYAAPGGNTMMTGPVGLVRAALFRFSR
jgi:uncharacterized protein (DUF1786 family)